MSDWDLAQLTQALGPGPVTELSYCFKNLTAVGRLNALSSLVQLNLSFNALTHLRGVQSLQHLQQLDVSHNKLTTLEGLSQLRRLTQLRCGNNRVRTTDVLAQLPCLQFLALHNNNISTAADVLRLSGLTRLKHLILRHNPVCKQEAYRHATIALLPSLQALDDTSITAEQRAAASAHAGAWAAAEQREYSCCSTPRDSSSAAGSDCGAGTDLAASSEQGAAAHPRRLSSTGSSSAGRLRARVSAAAQDDSISIKDATSMLPSMSLQPLKPSSLVRRPVAAPQPSRYGYSRDKPVTVLQKQTYQASGGSAVLIHSNGSASLVWPEGTMAASLEPEAPPPAGSLASTGGSAGLPPILGYRLLAMYRTVTGVAASFDSSGGFVQWSNGQLMLIWDKKDGKAYDPDGRATHNFTSRRKPPGALTQDISARLDENFSITFSASSHELQLSFCCEGCQAVLSQRRGAVLFGRDSQGAGAMQPSQGGSSRQPAANAAKLTAQAQQQQQQQQQEQEQEKMQPGQDSGNAGGAAAAVAGLPDEDGMQALLARARALMAATDLSPLPC